MILDNSYHPCRTCKKTGWVYKSVQIHVFPTNEIRLAYLKRRSEYEHPDWCGGCEGYYKGNHFDWTLVDVEPVVKSPTD